MFLRGLFVLFLVMSLSLAAQAQEADDDKGFLTRTIENALSGAGREVNIEGFTGALSAEASFQRMTIADDNGVWFTLDEVTLLWSRAALLRGRLQVEELSARRIDLPRLPVSNEAPELPDVEAEPFSLPQLPDLPVSVNIERFAVDEILLGEALLGDAAVLGLTAAARLDDDGLLLDLEAIRQDETRGRFGIDLTFGREDGQIALDFSLDEASGGLAAGLLNIPGNPSVKLTVAGAGPITDFITEIDLTTDDEPRLAGQVEVQTVLAEDGSLPDRRILADVGGDITALFAPEYQEFFGPDMGLRLDLLQRTNGAIEINDLRVAARAVQLAGQVRLNEEFWPDFIDIDGSLGHPDGAPVVPPGAGADTRIQSADVRVFYDVTAGDALEARVGVAGLEVDGAAVGEATLTVQGTIAGAAGTIGRFAGDVGIAANQFAFDDPDLAQAIGAEILARANLQFEEGSALQIAGLSLTGNDYSLTGDLTIEELAEGFPTDIDLQVEAPDMTRFAAIAGQDLSGAAQLSVKGQITPLSGVFDLEIAGNTQDLAIGIAEVDPILQGQSDLSMTAQRSTEGTFVRGLSLQNAALDVGADVSLRSDTSAVLANGRLNDLGLILPEHPGPVTFDLEAEQQQGNWQVSAALTAPYDAALTVEGLATGPDADVVIDIDLPDVQPLVPELSGPLTVDGRVWQSGGGYSVDVAGRGPLDAQFDANGLATGPDADLEIALSIPDLQPLVPDVTGGIVVEGRVSQGDSGYLVDVGGTGPFDTNFTLAGLATGPTMSLDVTARVPDVQPVVPQLNGSLSVAGNVAATAEGQYAIDVTANGPLAALLNAKGIATGPNAEIAFDLAVPDISDLAPQVSGPLQVAGTVRQQTSGYGIEIAGGGPLDARFTAEGMATGPDTDMSFELAVPSVQPLAPQVSGPLDVAGRVYLTERGYVVDVAGGGPLKATFATRGLATGPDAALDLDVQVPNIGALVRDLSGPVSVAAKASRETTGWRIDSTLDGPAGSTAVVAGLVGDDNLLDLRIQGGAPLGLAGPFIAPRGISGTARFDLAVQGAAGLDALSGRISTTGAEFNVPSQRLSIVGLDTNIDIAGGRVNIDLSGDVSNGGRITAGGTVGLVGALPADLEIALRDVILTDPRLYTTTVNGDIGINGPLSANASINGRIEIGETNISVPASGFTSVGAIPDIQHLGSTRPARRTREFAGIDETTDAAPQSSGSGGFGLSIDVNAPNRIFVRGRGLEAELGGSIEIRGSTSQIISAGEFSLVRGRLDLLGKRFDLVEGSAQFVGSTTPFIRFVTTASTRDGTASIIVDGPADEPTVTFESSPEAPEDEVIAQLLFNRSISELTAFQALQLANAVAVLAGRSGVGLIGSLREGFGLDDFDVTTTDSGATALRAGKYISDNVYTDFTVAGDGESELSINLDVTDSLKARASVSEDGNTGIGFFFERDY